MDPDRVKRIRVQPRDRLKRTSSRLGSGGNSSFSGETLPDSQTLRRYAVANPTNISLPPVALASDDSAMSRRQDSQPYVREPTPTKTEVQRIQMTDLVSDEGQAMRRMDATSGQDTAEFVSSSVVSRPEVYQQVLSKLPPRSARSQSGEASRLQDGVQGRSLDTQHGVPVASKLVDHNVKLIAAYWHQMTREGEVNIHVNQVSKEKIEQQVEQLLSDVKAEGKEKLYQEVKYIVKHFRQRRCVHFCQEERKFVSLLKKFGMKQTVRDLCSCGLPKQYHTREAINDPVSQWDVKNDTEIVYPCTFGNVDIPGHYNYLETPGGTRKYLRFDDLDTAPAHIWELLTNHWELKPPNLVISVTGGDVSNMHQNSNLHQSFINGILKSAVTTKAWIITDGFHMGASREISTIFQEHLQRSQWSENDDHASIPLIGFTPWGVIADRKTLHGINVGMDEAIYLYTSIEKYSQSSVVPNALDPNHVVYLFPDDGTAGRYKNEPKARRKLEKHIRHHTSLKLTGAKDVNTPVVILVLGGDQFTLEKLADCTAKSIQMSVVIVNGSGPIASMLAETYQRLEKEKPRSRAGRYGWSNDEEELLNSIIPKFEADGLLRKPEEKRFLRDIMKARHLIEVFGISEKDTKDLDKAILEATFGGTRDIVVQLNLTLAMDRCDIASSCIFLESRKQELKSVSETLQEVLLVAMEKGRTEFVELLLDQDYGGELDFQKLLTVERLHKLHSSNLDPSGIMGKILRSMCKRETNGSSLLARDQLLPQVGRIIYKLMGDNYRLLYQEKEYRQVSNDVIPLELTMYQKEEPVWHLLLWACLANQREMAELFLFETSCKIGAALIAFEMFSELSRQATSLSETELAEDLQESADYFQTLAMEILDNLYSFDRDEAYASITAVIPFRWSYYATPLHIAEDTEAMRFMGHACCQTFLNCVWYKYMDLDTKAWRLFPLFVFFPINLAGIVFDKRNLNYGTYRIGYDDLLERSRTLPVHSASGRQHNLSESYDNRALGSSFDMPGQSVERQKPPASSHSEHGLQKAWFRIKNYYTSPVNKFVLYFVSWLIFIGLFTHFLLNELRPVKTMSEVSIYEYIVICWVICISLDEAVQLMFTKSSGPLYNLSWSDIRHYWSDTWHLHERLFFILRLYKVTNWLEDGWNKLDLVMIICFWASVICRFSIGAPDFTIVRILFSVTIILFYYRILRISYIMKNIGHRVMTIHAMMKDLANFMLVLSIILVSFGVAFQAILNPNQPVSVEVLVDVLWRPYWQMFGELFIDDATTGMGRAKENQIVCTYNRTLANEFPEIHPFCYHWMAPVLLGVFMLFTNILLLNLLIAIFSHSFEKIEREAQTIWRYHLYDLVHEYYHQVWLPPPLNILCYMVQLLAWLLRWPRKWAYKAARNRILKRIQSRPRSESLIGQGPDIHFLNSKLERQINEELKKDCCYKFYYNEAQEEEVTHFRQPEIMRNEDLEEKAYKRYMRSAAKEKERDIRKILKHQNSKLNEVAANIEDFKENINNPMSSDYTPELSRSMTSGHGDSGHSLTKKVNSMDVRLKEIDYKLDIILRGINGSGSHVIQRSISGLADYTA